ncbi:MAG: S-layer homology domain-containing protein [Thermaerobacterales bacterium]
MTSQGVMLLAGPVPDMEHHWSSHEVSHLITSGIVTGYPDDTFRPDAPMTRSEWVVTLARP